MTNNEMMKNGKYVIGDPCYIIPRESYKRFLEAFWAAENKNERGITVVKYEGHNCFVSDTFGGDGIFPSSIGFEFEVDTGLIAAIPVEVIEIIGQREDRKEDCITVYCDDDAPVRYDKGTISFANLKIWTVQ